MQDFYGKWILKALKAVDKRGVRCEWTTVRASGPSYAPTTVEEKYSAVKIAVLPTDRYAYETFNIDPKTEMLRGFSVGYMGQQVFTPNLKDFFETEDGRKFVIENMNTYNPDGRQILHVLLLRT